MLKWLREASRGTQHQVIGHLPHSAGGPMANEITMGANGITG